MRILGIWRRAAFEASRWRSVAGFRRLRFSDGDERLLQLARRWKIVEVADGGGGCGGGGFFYGTGGQPRSLASSAATHPQLNEPQDGLQHVLRCEVEDLMKKSMNIQARKPPRPFTLVKDEPDDLEITLTRMYGLEDITMSCVLNLVPKKYQHKPEVGEDPEARAKMLQLTISIVKGAAHPVLKIKCECYRIGFVIHQVDLESEDDEQSVYRPYFSDSKIKLANEFQIFLYERGLNADLAKYIEMHLDKKRMLKSANMITKMGSFLEK